MGNLITMLLLLPTIKCGALQTEATHVVENLLLLSTVDSDSFRAFTWKIPGIAGAGPSCRKTFSKYIDAEYAKMNAELKRGKTKKYAIVTFNGN